MLHDHESRPAGVSCPPGLTSWTSCYVETKLYSVVKQYGSKSAQHLAAHEAEMERLTDPISRPTHHDIGEALTWPKVKHGRPGATYESIAPSDEDANGDEEVSALSDEGSKLA